MTIPFFYGHTLRPRRLLAPPFAASILLFAAAARAQTCPRVTMNCSPASVVEGREFRCTAEPGGVSGSGARGYVWNVSAGDIVGAQTGRTIRVSTVGLGGQTVMVSMQISGCDELARRNIAVNPEDTSLVGGEQTDLSGTYVGALILSGGNEMEGKATLTISGNTFQLEGGGVTHAGRVYAVTTRAYTGVAFYFADLTNPSTNTPVVANVRAFKSGDLLTLTPVPGTSAKMRFVPSGGGGVRRRHGRRN